jgi:siroheme synthase
MHNTPALSLSRQGVSAALSAPLLGGIPITHRGVSNQVVICTGYGKDGSSPDILKYHREQTVVFLMAVGRLQELMGKLQTIGEYPPIIPVAIVERAGCADKQRTIVGTVSNIASIADKHHVQAPSTIIVGNVVRVLLANDFDKLSCNFDDQEVWNGVTFHELLLPTLQV